MSEKKTILKFEIDNVMGKGEYSSLVNQVGALMLRHSPPNIAVDRIHKCSRNVALIIDTWLNPEWNPPTAEEEFAELIAHTHCVKD